MTGVPSRTTVVGGTVVTPDRCIDGGIVSIRGDRIEAVERDGSIAADAIDASGQYVLPGFVDLHGDDLERHVSPRPEARIDPNSAIPRCDVSTISAGITTKLHAIAFEDAPDGLRSVTLAHEICDAIRTFASGGDSLADHRLHLRCELTDRSSAAGAQSEIERGASLVSLVEHVPGEGQYDDLESLGDKYRTDGSTELLDELGDRRDVTVETKRRRARRIARAATSAGIALASHDDPGPQAVEHARAIGVDICEFPLTLDAARAAGRAGMTVVLGAPNVVRGGSLWDNLDAREAIRAGAVDVLCSDFRPHAMLEAVFEDGDPLPSRVEMLTRAPADAVGLGERGRLEPGARADLIVVDPEPVPSVTRAFVAGREVYRAGR